MPGITLLHVFSTFAVGGPQRRAVAIANALGSDYRHLILPVDGRTEAAAGFAPGIEAELHDLPLVKTRGISIANLRRLRAFAASARPQLLLTYNFGAIEAALANRLLPVCPHLHIEDGFGPEEADGRQLPRRVWLRRLALSGQSRILVPSRTLEAIATDVWRFAPQRVLYIPNGVDTERCAALAGTAPLGLRQAAGEALVGSIGLLRPEKNVGRLLRVFAQAARGREARLVIVGDGPERVPLEAMAAGLGIARQVTFTGFLERPEEALVELDIFALSSDTEQMPLGMVEAMAAGLPVVATDVGDVRALLPGAQRACVVAREDEAGMASALRRLLDEPDLRRSLGQANRPHARERYGLARMVDRYASLFASLLEEGPGRRPSVAADSAS